MSAEAAQQKREGLIRCHATASGRETQACREDDNLKQERGVWRQRLDQASSWT